MGKTSFENLKVYTMSETFSDEVWNLVARWEHFARESIGRQLVRAADSIGANIAEGVGRYTDAEHRRFALIARGSLYESRHWLRRAFCRNLLSADEAKRLSALLDELSLLLSGYIRSFKNK